MLFVGMKLEVLENAMNGGWVGVPIGAVVDVFKHGEGFAFDYAGVTHLVDQDDWGIYSFHEVTLKEGMRFRVTDSIVSNWQGWEGISVGNVLTLWHVSEDGYIASFTCTDHITREDVPLSASPELTLSDEGLELIDE